MSKKLLLGILLSIGLQALNAADAGEQLAPDAADAAAQPLVLANFQENRQVVLQNQQQQALTAAQIAAAASTLAFSTAQQVVPLVGQVATATATLAAEQVREMAEALKHRYYHSGTPEAAASVGFGCVAGYVAKCVAGKFFGTFFELPAFAVATVLGTELGARVITRDRIKSCSFIVKDNNQDGDIIYETKNKTEIDLETINFIFPVTVTYTVDSFYVPRVSETLLCMTREDLNAIIRSFKRALEAGKR